MDKDHSTGGYSRKTTIIDNVYGDAARQWSDDKKGGDKSELEFAKKRVVELEQFFRNIFGGMVIPKMWTVSDFVHGKFDRKDIQSLGENDSRYDEVIFNLLEAYRELREVIQRNKK